MPLYTYSDRSGGVVTYKQAYVTGQHHIYYPWVLPRREGMYRPLFLRLLVVEPHNVQLHSLCFDDSRPAGFGHWLLEQLKPKPLYLADVRSVVDKYLWATLTLARQYEALERLDRHNSAPHIAIKQAAACAFQRLEFLFKTSTQLAAEEREAVASAANFRRERALHDAEWQTELAIADMDQSWLSDKPLTEL